MRQLIRIAEDDPSIQKIFSIILQREGYEIEIYSDGKQLYEEKRGQPSLFILDRQLENSDGLETCRYLKSNKETSNIPVIMISAQPGTALLAKDAGAEDFIEKPFSIALLLEKIRKFIVPS